MQLPANQLHSNVVKQKLGLVHGLYTTMALKSIFYLLVTVNVAVIVWVLLKYRGVSLVNNKYEYRGVSLVNNKYKYRETKIFIIVRRYSGQQGAGVNAITSLQCWAGHSGLQMSIVEPFMSRTSFFGSLLEKENFLKLSDYFDYEHLNKASREAKLAEFTTLDQFVKEGSKNIIFIATYSKIMKVVSSSNGSCLKIRAVPKKTGYCVVAIIYTNQVTQTLQNDNLRDNILGKWLNEGVTIMLSLWRGPICIHKECEGVGLATKNQFLPSARILRDAEQYRRLSSDSSIAFMIRLEHIILMSRRSSENTIPKCIEKLSGVLEDLQEGTHGVPMIAADIGKYGSRSWTWGIHNEQEVSQAKDLIKSMMMNIFKSSSMSFENWEESFVKAAGGQNTSGYIAALQRTIASQAECLVLMGGGNFQEMALVDYLRFQKNRRREPCVHLICVDGGKLESVLNSAKRTY